MQQVGPAHVHTSTLHGLRNPKGREAWVGLLNITIWTTSPVGPSLMEIDSLDRWWRRSRVFYGEESSPPVPECLLRSQNRLCRLLLILVHGEKLSGSILKWWETEMSTMAKHIREGPCSRRLLLCTWAMSSKDTSLLVITHIPFSLLVLLLNHFGRERGTCLLGDRILPVIMPYVGFYHGPWGLSCSM